MIDFERKLIFLHIPKAAGTSIEAALLGDPEMGDHKTGKRFNKIKTVYKKNFLDGAYGHNTLLEYKNALGVKFKQYTVFTVIRNPWHRVVSHFLYTFRHEKKELTKQDFKKYVYHHPEYHNLMSYKQVVSFRREKDVDFILRTEHLNQDFENMCKKLGLKNLKIPQFNVSKAKNKSYDEWYDRQTRKKVAKDFAYDIERFGYTFGSKESSHLLFSKLSLGKKIKLFLIYAKNRVKL